MTSDSAGESGAGLPVSICGANDGERGICTRPPAGPSGRCKRHGGKSLSGVDHPSFRHGKYSVALKRLGVDLEERLNDPTLVDIRRPLVAQDEVLARLTKRVADHDTADFRARALGLHEEAMAALPNDPSRGLGLLRELGDLLRRGAAEDRALEQVARSAALMTQQQLAYWKVALAGRRAISADEFRLLMTRMFAILCEHHGDQEAFRVMERVDAEACAGALGFKGASERAGQGEAR